MRNILFLVCAHSFDRMWSCEHMIFLNLKSSKISDWNWACECMFSLRGVLQSCGWGYAKLSIVFECMGRTVLILKYCRIPFCLVFKVLCCLGAGVRVLCLWCSEMATDNRVETHAMTVWSWGFVLRAASLRHRISSFSIAVMYQGYWWNLSIFLWVTVNEDHLVRAIRITQV